MAHNDDAYNDWDNLRFRECWHEGYVIGAKSAEQALKEKNI